MGKVFVAVMIVYVALVMYGISLLTLGDDESAAQSRVIRKALRVVALVALVVSAIVAFRSQRLAMLVMAVSGFVVLLLVALLCRRRQGGCTVRVPGVYLGEDVRTGLNARDEAGHLQPLHVPFFQYQYDGDIYCTPSQDLVFASTLSSDFHEGRFYWLSVDPNEPWRCRYSRYVRGAGQAMSIAFVFLAFCGLMLLWAAPPVAA